MILTPELRKANSLKRCSRVEKLKSVKEKVEVKAFVDFYFLALDEIVPAVGYVPMLSDQKQAALDAWKAFSQG